MDKGAIEDKYVYAEIAKLIKEYEINTIVETGTYRGWSAKKLAEFGLPVFTIEIDKENFEMAASYLKDTKNVFRYLGSSPNVIDEILEERDLKNTLFFLDAHWGEYWPLHDEILTMKKYEIKPVILIHDFFVPDEHGKAKFGYDVYKKQALDYSYVKPSIDTLYGGEDKYIHYCIQEAEVNAGVGVFVPKKG
jgi:predicted O-methyltransferase YrrM